MIEAIKSWFRAKFPPTVASIYSYEWTIARRERQLRPFVIPRSDLFEHGLGPVQDV